MIKYNLSTKLWYYRLVYSKAKLEGENESGVQQITGCSYIYTIQY